jgi:hypothetical protein
MTEEQYETIRRAIWHDDEHAKGRGQIELEGLLNQPEGRPTIAELRDCLDFWNHYSSINEPAQDDIAEEKNAMLRKMADWLSGSQPQETRS